MIRSFTLGEIAGYLNGQLVVSDTSDIASNALSDVSISGISIDSRSISANELFVAIKGPRFDGHQYLAKAQEAGASAVVVEQVSDSIRIPQIRVDDTFKALGRLGQMNRGAFSGKVVGVTGSCGKTSVKEMLSAIFGEQSPVLSTSGNLNNGYGVPLTLFKLEKSHEYAVVELGTSAPGEIEYISGLAQADISILNNAAETHLADLGSVQGVAWEKGFILDALGDEGVAILNRDDAFFPEWLDRVMAVGHRKVLSFSLGDRNADCFASNIKPTEQGMHFDLSLSGEVRPVRLAFYGRHQVANACCAAAASLAAGIELDIIIRGLENARPYQRRGLRYQLPASANKGKVTVFDETYNANPKATLAAIDQLSDCSGKKVMVFGDMLDLGEIAEARHHEVGQYARKQGIQYFAGFGSLAKQACAAFGKEGRHFESKAALTSWVESLINEESGHVVSVLVKGSRGMEMLDVVRSLVGPEYEGER